MAERHRRAIKTRWDKLTPEQRRDATAAARAARWPDPDAPEPADPFAELRDHFDAELAKVHAVLAELRDQRVAA